MSKHTRGPWTIHPKWGQPAVGVDVGDGGPLLPIAEVVGGQNKTAAKANARLIAAAPDLLAALRESAGEFARLAGMLQDGNPLFGKILRDAATAAYSAIAKAEGGGA